MIVIAGEKKIDYTTSRNAINNTIIYNGVRQGRVITPKSTEARIVRYANHSSASKAFGVSTFFLEGLHMSQA